MCIKKVNSVSFDFMSTSKYSDDDDYSDYLSVLRSDAIYSALYDGTGVIEILRGHEFLSHPFAVSLFGGNVYWTDWRTNTLTKANKWTGANVTVIQKTSAQPFDLEIYHPSRQPQSKKPSRCLSKLSRGTLNR